MDREVYFINALLKKENFETDVIQSLADANRNVSSGEKMFLQKTGEATVKKTSGIFEIAKSALHQSRQKKMFTFGQKALRTCLFTCKTGPFFKRRPLVGFLGNHIDRARAQAHT